MSLREKLVGYADRLGLYGLACLLRRRGERHLGEGFIYCFEDVLRAFSLQEQQLLSKPDKTVDEMKTIVLLVASRLGRGYDKDFEVASQRGEIACWRMFSLNENLHGVCRHKVWCMVALLTDAGISAKHYTVDDGWSRHALVVLPHLNLVSDPTQRAGELLTIKQTKGIYGV